MTAHALSRRSCYPIAIGAILLLIATLGAESLNGIPNPRTRDGTWVTDMPGALRAETVARLNATIGELERTNGAEMAVVVIRSLDGLAVEEAAVKLFELWGIGKKDKDNGLLFLWSTGDRRVRVEVGYGLEGALPDGKVGAILDTYVIPKFKPGTSTKACSTASTRWSRRAPSQSNWRRRRPSRTIRRPGALPRCSPAYPARSRRRLARSPAFAGGAGTGGAGARNVDAMDDRLAETEDDALLAEGQQAEERVGSVDYDVWKCAACSHHFIMRYPKWLTGYAKCPQCRNRTKSSSETVIDAPPPAAAAARAWSSSARSVASSRAHRVLPRIQQSSSSGGSSGGSSSSFGGGSSGGGGASRGY